MDSDVPLNTAIEIIIEGRYAIVAVSSLQLYEWFAAISMEVELVHGSRWSSVKIAYLLCRYYPLLLWPLVMMAYAGSYTWQACTRLGPAVYILLGPCQLFPQAVMLMRAYAFSGRDRRILVLLLTCYAGLVAVDIWSFCTHITVLPEIVYMLLGKTGCYPYFGKGFMGFRIGYSMVAATSMDLISLTIVLVHCVRTRTQEISLARYFVNQGLVSFGLALAVNIGAAGFFFNQKSPHNGLGLPFVLVVSNIIACRVILDLRRKVSPTDSELAYQHSHLVREALRTRSAGSSHDGWLMQDGGSDIQRGPLY